MGEFRMPSLGADMEEGTVIEWLVAPGDTVHRGDVIAVVDTEKSTIEAEVFEDGIVEEIVVPVGTEVAVGTPLARLSPLGAASPAPAEAPVATGRPAPGQPAPVPEPAEPAAPAAPAPRRAAAPRAARRRPAAPTPAPEPAKARATVNGHVAASPLARRLAAERGIDLASIVGTGRNGAVVAADIDALAGAATAATPRPARPRRAPPQRPTAERLEAARQATGRLMARSSREIPHYYLATTIDFAAARAWLTDANASRPPSARILPGALLLKATALAARGAPALNGTWEDGLRSATAVHLGVAVALRGGGLVAPAIRDADQLDLDGLMAALRGLVERARSGALRSSDLEGATITVTNLGDQGAEEVHGVIYPPQVALVGFGRVVERPWAVDGMLGVRPLVRATLAADHRASDGHVGSRFLAEIDRRLQEPEEL
jgi:pyruvate dehydrogenase E2 component (dihydrolipoamide acetyltransferase)